MKAGKTTTVKTVSGKKTAEKKANPFTKLMDDKKRIAKAVTNSVALSSLKGIKFVRPI
ncbi:hypothetical protein ACFGVR_15265 [Mucilaginibacter sp. AW1-3]